MAHVPSVIGPVSSGRSVIARTAITTSRPFASNLRKARMRLQCLAIRAAFEHFLLLVRREAGAPTWLDSSLNGSPPALARASSDQLPFEFGKTAEHQQHATMRGGGVGPSIDERFERGTLFCKARGCHLSASALPFIARITMKIS